jgi:hypothetical protein
MTFIANSWLTAVLPSRVLARRRLNGSLQLRGSRLVERRDWGSWGVWIAKARLLLVMEDGEKSVLDVILGMWRGILRCRS